MHYGGKVDRRFADGCPWLAYTLGQWIVVVARYTYAVLLYATVLFCRVGEHFGRDMTAARSTRGEIAGVDDGHPQLVWIMCRHLEMIDLFLQEPAGSKRFRYDVRSANVDAQSKVETTVDRLPTYDSIETVAGSRTGSILMILPYISGVKQSI